MEALDVENMVSVEELQEIIEKDGTAEKDVKYDLMKEKLYELIVEKKKVPFKDLVNQHFNLPVDRVSRLIDML